MKILCINSLYLNLRPIRKGKKMETELEDLLKKLNLEESVLKNTLKNKKLSKKFEKLLEGSPTEYDKPSGKNSL
jgi:hypothetical protein